jgi:hypothetical protein
MLGVDASAKSGAPPGLRVPDEEYCHPRALDTRGEKFGLFEEVAKAADADLGELRARGLRIRESATETMIRGAANKLRSLQNTGVVEGVISIDGMSSATMASTIMKEVSSRIP